MLWTLCGRRWNWLAAVRLCWLVEPWTRHGWLRGKKHRWEIHHSAFFLGAGLGLILIPTESTIKKPRYSRCQTTYFSFLSAYRLDENLADSAGPGYWNEKPGCIHLDWCAVCRALVSGLCLRDCCVFAAAWQLAAAAWIFSGPWRGGPRQWGQAEGNRVVAWLNQRKERYPGVPGVSMVFVHSEPAVSVFITSCGWSGRLCDTIGFLSSWMIIG